MNRCLLLTCDSFLPNPDVVTRTLDAEERLFHSSRAPAAGEGARQSCRRLLWGQKGPATHRQTPCFVGVTTVVFCRLASSM